MWKSTFIKILFRVVLFLAVFTGTALIINAISNRGSDRTYVELDGATLPVVYTYYGEERLTALPAYKQDMDPALIRDSIVPVGDAKTVSFSIATKGSSLGEVSYQLRDSTGETLIEEGKLETTQLREGVAFCNAEIRMDMKKDQPYNFVIQIIRGDDTLRYYTRVVRLEREYVNACLAAAGSFHKLLLSEKTEAIEKEIKAYLEEAPEEYDREDLGFVSLFSTYETLAWVGLSPEISEIQETALTELYDDGGTVVYHYLMNTVEEETQEIRTYRVEEHFVLEYVPELGAARIKDYFRRMNRQFTPLQFERDINGIRIGTSDRDVVFRTSENNQHTVFATDGSVWYYDYNASTLTRIYGAEADRAAFTGMESPVVLFVDNTEAYFAVYGRISSGAHEGENGILIQQFDEEKRVIRECAFISTNLPYEWMTREVGRLLYLNETEGVLFYLLNQSLHSLNLKTGEEQTLAEGLSVPSVLVSRDGSVIAFPEDSGKTPGAESITLWDLASEKKNTITESGKQLEALTFIGEDFVYGTAKPENVSVAADGSPSMLYSNLKLLNRDGSLEKDYSQGGLLISGVRFLNNTIYLSLLALDPDSGVKVEADPDYITYKLEDEKGKTVQNKEPGVDGYSLVFPGNIYMTSIPEELISKAGTEEGYQVRIKGAIDRKCGYLFLAGHLSDMSERIGITIREAVQEHGYVVLADGSTLYRRRTGAPYLTVADSVNYVKAGDGENGYTACLVMALQMAGVETTYDAAKHALDEHGGNWDQAFEKLSDDTVSGLNLSGADLDTAVLFLGDGVPFAARLENRYVFVVSFNSDAIRYYDPTIDNEVRVDRNTFRNKVDSAGNEFFTYVN